MLSAQARRSGRSARRVRPDLPMSGRVITAGKAGPGPQLSSSTKMALGTYVRAVSMNTTQWIAVASVAAVLVSALAIAATLKGVRDQLRVTVFLTYTERYAQVMNDVPFEARRPGSEYQLSSRPPEEQARVLSAFREYFNLCSEEIWLHERHRIDRATWLIWKRGMQQVARFPPFQDAWEFLASEYEYYGPFSRICNEGTVSVHSQWRSNPHASRTAISRPPSMERIATCLGPLGKRSLRTRRDCCS